MDSSQNLSTIVKQGNVMIWPREKKLVDLIWLESTEIWAINLWLIMAAIEN